MLFCITANKTVPITHGIYLISNLITNEKPWWTGLETFVTFCNALVTFQMIPKYQLVLVPLKGSQLLAYMIIFTVPEKRLFNQIW